MHIDIKNATRRQTAAAMGVSETTIGAWFASGCPRGENGRYSIPEVVQWRIKRLQSGRPTSEKLDAASLRYRKARARKLELEVGVKTGKLVDREAVTRAVQSSILIAKDRLLGIPAEIGNQLSGTIDRAVIAEVAATAERIIRQALTELAATKEAENGKP